MPETGLRLALLGTRGVPARYGGFETAVEEVGRRLVEKGHRVVVYCRDAPEAEGGGQDRLHLGMRLVHLPALRRRSLETLSHSALSVGHLLAHARPDAAFVFNSANAPLLPALRAARIPVATHVDGLEWRRAKWEGAGRRYYRAAESAAVRFSDALIADAQGIADYYADEFAVPTELIAYGAPVVEPDPTRLAELDLQAGGYHLVVARFEPENHVDLIVEGYAASSSARPLVVVGSAPYAEEHTAAIRSLADDRVRFVGGVWDQGLLDALYAGARSYLHGHSVGGTNPSLLRALGAGAPVSAFDVSFNREVAADAGRWFSSPSDVSRLVAAADAADDGALAARRTASRERAAAYDWDDVADRYEDLAARLADGRARRRMRAGLGRRTGAGAASVDRPSTGRDGEAGRDGKSARDREDAALTTTGTVRA